MHYCVELNHGHLPSSIWIITVGIILFHGFGISLLEGYCSILPPPIRHDAKQKQMKRRPAVYLLKIIVNIISVYLLAPVAIVVFIPNLTNAVKTIAYHAFLKEINDDLQVSLPLDAASSVCYAEVAVSIMHLISFVFEIITFKLGQSCIVLIHHFASILYLFGRISPWTYVIPDWLWMALSLHLFIYSLNLIRPCYSFLRHFLPNDSSGALFRLQRLFHTANMVSWVVILFGYFVASVVVASRRSGSLQEGLICFVTLAPLFYGSFKEMQKAKSERLEITRRCHDPILSQASFEIVVGLFLAPVLLLLDYLFPRGIERFTKKSSHKNTAGGVVSLRALCYAESDPRLHIDDPFALQFVESRLSRVICKSAVLRYIMFLKLERHHPGAVGHLITRTLTIDEAIGHLTSLKDRPVRQLVVLGAGYDTRAYRLMVLKDVVVFEIDQHTISCEKQQKCADLTPVCKELVHLCADFNNESVADILLACTKFDPTLPTFFLWEGVQVYLSDDSVDKMFVNLRAMNQNVKNTSQYLYFTFSDRGILTHDGRERIYGGEEFYKYASEMGEKVKSGLNPTSIKEYLVTRGFVPYMYDLCVGLSGHMTPAQKESHYLSGHPFIRQSEVFHSCLVRNVPSGMTSPFELIDKQKKVQEGIENRKELEKCEVEFRLQNQ